ncbi:MAG: lytic transglycosylase domain-containing protein [Terriglobia bacterium]|nr:MAG: lytic transglycosylase domain-containing protein [Terriglobia bacterium]
MKLFASTLILCLSALGGEIATPAEVSPIGNLPEPPRIPFHLPDPAIAVKAREAPMPPALPLIFPKDTRALIREAAMKHQVPAAFVSSIVRAESNFDPLALSPKGAIGLMQLMPETAQQFGADPHVPEQNIDAGTRYLRWLVNRYHKYRDGLKRAIAAYNAGPGMVDRYRGVPPFPETRVYVARVMGFLKEFQRRRG